MTLAAWEARLKPSARPVLARLRQGPATTHDLCQPDVGGIRFGARLKEMRDLGCVVSESRLPRPARGSLYTLVSEPAPAAPAPVEPPAPEGCLFDPGPSHRPLGAYENEAA